jgi:hypothetical protein
MCVAKTGESISAIISYKYSRGLKGGPAVLIVEFLWT